MRKEKWEGQHVRMTKKNKKPPGEGDGVFFRPIEETRN
jgi:hypothetical protein